MSDSKEKEVPGMLFKWRLPSTANMKFESVFCRGDMQELTSLTNLRADMEQALLKQEASESLQAIQAYLPHIVRSQAHNTAWSQNSNWCCMPGMGVDVDVVGDNRHVIDVNMKRFRTNDGTGKTGWYAL